MNTFLFYNLVWLNCSIRNEWIILYVEYVQLILKLFFCCCNNLLKLWLGNLNFLPIWGEASILVLGRHGSLLRWLLLWLLDVWSTSEIIQATTNWLAGSSNKTTIQNKEHGSYLIVWHYRFTLYLYSILLSYMMILPACL